jgi:hypothetical protein
MPVSALLHLLGHTASDSNRVLATSKELIHKLESEVAGLGEELVNDGHKQEGGDHKIRYAVQTRRLMMTAVIMTMKKFQSQYNIQRA